MDVARGPRKPSDAAAATEPEDRHALDGSRQIETVHQLGVEARDREARDGVDEQGADILELDAGGLDGAERHLLEQGKRVVLEDFRPRLPTMSLVVPLGRLTSVAAVDAGIGVEAFEP